MTVNIILITQEAVGNALLNSAKITFGKRPAQVMAFPISHDIDPDILMPILKDKVQKMDEGEGILILTDMFGTTPSHLAKALQENCEKGKVKIVTGLNLPMLIRTINHQELALDELAEKAMSGGREGVIGE